MQDNITTRQRKDAELMASAIASAPQDKTAMLDILMDAIVIGIELGEKCSVYAEDQPKKDAS